MKNNIDFSKIRSDFPFYQKNHDLAFFDSAATSLKPKVVLDAMNDYYLNYTTNIHSSSFPLAIETNKIYKSCRQEIAKFINAPSSDEVIFCLSATFALNQIAYSIGEYLKAGDEVILTTCEHSSLLLPFYRLVEEKKVVLKFIDVTDTGLITVENLKKALTKKTKVVAFANMNNSFGTINDVKKLTKVIKNHEIEKVSLESWPFEKPLVVIDGAQGICHVKSDVSDWDIDFFSFSAHKIFGPTGIGIWWAKSKWLSFIKPLILGGGTNARMYVDQTYTSLSAPYYFEAGTPNISGVFGLKAAIEYVTKLGVDTIYEYEMDLKDYAVEQFKKHFSDKVIIYNEKQRASILLFNVKDVFAEDVANYLGYKNVAVRSGNFCAKLLSEVINCAASLRASFSIYNNKKDVDQLVSALEQGFKDGGDFLNEFFQ